MSRWTLHARACATAVVLLAGSAFAGPALDFDAERASGHLRAFMDLSPIAPGSAAAVSFAAYVRSQLTPLGFQVEEDTWNTPDAPVPLRNLVARRGSGRVVRMVGAHYDTRIWADKDPDPARQHDPVPGANDGGSGVAVLLELARSVRIPAGMELRLAFFDGEDQGGIPGWGGWILGSRRMASRLSKEERDRIEAVVVVDIVGEPGLRLVREGGSDPQLASRVWEIGRQLGYSETFQDGLAGAVTDDHVPFRELGIRALDLIPVEGRDGSAFFPWHHTTLDTRDRVSVESLGRVGKTLEAFLESPPLDADPPWPPGGVRWLLLLAGLLALAAVVARARRGARLTADSRPSGPRRRGASRQTSS
jgi:peptidase M28-like protein